MNTRPVPFAAIVSVVALVSAVLARADVAQATDDAASPPATVQQQKPAADGWYDAALPSGAFQVRLPGAYQVFSEEGALAGGVPIHTDGVRASVPAALGGVTNYMTSCLVQENEVRSAEERLRAATERWEKLGMMRYRRSVTLGEHPGVEFEMADDVKVIRARVYSVADRSCTVLLSWPHYAKPNDAHIAKYLDSFRRTR